jgi:hypothetical protein
MSRGQLLCRACAWCWAPVCLPCYVAPKQGHTCHQKTSLRGPFMHCLSGSVALLRAESATAHVVGAGLPSCWVVWCAAALACFLRGLVICVMIWFQSLLHLS